MTNDRDSAPPTTDLAQLALDKLTRVLGAGPAQRVFAQALAEARLTGIHTPEELYRFGDQLSKHSGFEAAVGRMLTVAAVIRGATGSSRSS